MNNRLYGLALALLCGVSHAQEFFSGEWDGSEHIYLRQVGNKVCGLWSYVATGRGYEGRMLGTAKSNYLKLDWACGTPGSRTRTYCDGAAPRGEPDVGWSPSNEEALVCNGRLWITSNVPPSCPPPSKTVMWDDRVSVTVGQSDVRAFDADEIAWANECATTLGRDEGALSAVLRQPQPPGLPASGSNRMRNEDRLVTVDQLPQEWKEGLQLPRSVMTYCSTEASHRSLIGGERKAFMLSCSGLNIRSELGTFYRCRAQSIGLEGQAYLETYKSCLLASGAREAIPLGR